MARVWFICWLWVIERGREYLSGSQNKVRDQSKVEFYSNKIFEIYWRHLAFTSRILQKEVARWDYRKVYGDLETSNIDEMRRYKWRERIFWKDDFWFSYILVILESLDSRGFGWGSEDGRLMKEFLGFIG